MIIAQQVQGRYNVKSVITCTNFVMSYTKYESVYIKKKLSSYNIRLVSMNNTIQNNTSAEFVRTCY